MKTWKVSENYSDKHGVYLEFNIDNGKYELSPTPYFKNEIVEKGKSLRLYSKDIGYREACQELYRLYGDEWNI